MNYEHADKLLRDPRNPNEKQNITYYCKNTHLKRRNGYIAVDHGIYKDLVKFHPDGRIEIFFETPSLIQRWGNLTIDFPEGSSRLATSYDTRELLNRLELGYYVYPLSFHTMITKGSASCHDQTKGWEIPIHIVTDKDGNILSQIPEKPLTYDVINKHYSRMYYQRESTRRRGRYWTRRARNLYIDRSGCTKGVPNCSTRGWRRRNMTRAEEFQCGCKTYRKNIKFRYKVKRILDEPNATVRACMIKLYGIDKFFNDAKAGTIHEHGNYKLLELKLPPTTDANSLRTTRLNNMRALRMVCPSTGQIYVNLVPQDRQTVQQALDWMFSTTDYLGRVKQAT